MIAKVLPLHTVTQSITLLCIIISSVFPQLMAAYEWQIAIGMIVLLGIPHGATDHLIFVHSSRPFLGARGLEQFYGYYLLLIVLYGLMWWLLPILAFGIFLSISVYHFGQSNWTAILFPTKRDAVLTYLCWGAFVLFIPIIWHFDTAAPIISNITNNTVPTLSKIWKTTFCIAIFFLNCWLIGYWWRSGVLHFQELLRELLHLTLLMLLFLTTPLLLGFTIYFVVWHSLSSVVDQIAFFKRHFKWYNWQRYARQTLPLSLVAIGSLGLLFGVKTWLGLSPNIDVLFIFISVVTLPHMLLIEQLYEEKKNSEYIFQNQEKLKI